MRVIDSVFPLSKAPDAHRRMESNQNVEKIVLTIEHICVSLASPALR